MIDVIRFLLYIAAIALFVYDIFIFQYFYTNRLLHLVPLVFSPLKSRKLVVQEICKHYKNAKLICEVGSGFGGFSRRIARKTQSKVIGIEKSWLNVFISNAFGFLSQNKAKIVLADAFKWLEQTKEKIDIIVIYMGPVETNKLKLYSDKIRVVISLDFQMSDITPVRVIKAGKGYTKFNGIKYPHRIYVYEF